MDSIVHATALMSFVRKCYFCHFLSIFSNLFGIWHFHTNRVAKSPSKSPSKILYRISWFWGGSLLYKIWRLIYQGEVVTGLAWKCHILMRRERGVDRCRPNHTQPNSSSEPLPVIWCSFVVELLRATVQGLNCESFEAVHTNTHTTNSTILLTSTE